MASNPLTNIQRLTESGLARQLKVSRQAVHELVKRGVLSKDKDGLIDFELAKHALMNRVRPSAKTAAALMGMNNIYYRYVHLSPTADFKTMRAGLRMNGMVGHGADGLDFELWSLAVSAVNGCGMCIESHEHEVFKKGATKEQVQAVVKIAAVITAVSAALEGAAALGE